MSTATSIRKIIREEMSHEETPYERIQRQLKTLPLDSEDWNAKMDAQRKERRKLIRAEIAKLPPVGQRPKCRQCGKELRVDATPAKAGFGYGRNGKFCTLNCGFRWALRVAT